MVARHRDVGRNPRASKMHGPWVRGVRRQQEDRGPLSQVPAPFSKVLMIRPDDVLPRFPEAGRTEPSQSLAAILCSGRRWHTVERSWPD